MSMDEEPLDVEVVEPPSPRWYRLSAGVMLVCAIAGFISALELSIEAWQLAKDSTSQFFCDVSSTVSCSTVAQTWQAEILGFPNAFLGVGFGAVAMAIAVAYLAGTPFARWYSLCLEVLFTGGLLFAVWLFVQSFFVIRVLCPWCLLTFFSTLLMWWCMTRIQIREGHFGQNTAIRRWVAHGSDWVPVILLIVALVAVVAVKYGPGLLG